MSEVMRTERGFDRLVNFSDAVVAIAITLLILPLVDTATELDGMTLSELFEKDGQKLLVFVISFVVIGRFWLAHHRIYERIVSYNTTLIWVNMFWLLTIVFLPFPTELIATTGSANPDTTLLYVGTMLATSVSSAAQQWVIVRSPDLQAPEVRGTLTVLPSLATSVMMLVVLLVALALPDLGLLPLLLLLFTGPVLAVLNRVEKRRALRAGRARPTPSE
ncbi:TMEM175 family protein [Herbiconiux sp.]|uniref:TMEM175 family protein n=1 Tax=Herbiconiux sp. TaxID=1871186 RepID=UPI0025BD214F|nr:TMEM175 family protein [Herbiconiux sp.]